MVTLYPETDILIRERKGDKERQEFDHLETEAEIRVMWP